MKKNIFVIAMLMFFQSLAMAQMPVANEKSNAITYYANEFADIINRVQLEKDTAYMVSTVKVADACVTMMNKNQILGKVGETILKELTKNSSKYPNLLDGGKVKKSCRKYEEMNDNQRALVWVLVMTTMAHFESSCSDKAKAKGPNGMAYGYFQLHKGKENLYVKGKGSCVKNASGNAALASKCALGMLEKQMERSSGVLFDNKSYWEVLRPIGPAQKSQHIAKALAKSSLCNPAVM